MPDSLSAMREAGFQTRGGGVHYEPTVDPPLSG